MPNPRDCKINLSSYLSGHSSTIRSVIKKTGSLNQQVCIVIDDKDEVMGLVTNKELRAAILSSTDLNSSICTIMNTGFKFLNASYSDEQAADLFNTFPFVKQIPVLKDRKLIEIISVDDNRFKNKVMRKRSSIDADVVIMAGGLGTRMHPFTSIFPKALLPIAEETILEKIIKQFGIFNVADFYISINHKSKLIKAYLQEVDLDYSLHFIKEEKPLGTIGALKLAEDRLRSTTFVSNCDTLVYGDYTKMYEFHKSKNLDLTIICAYKEEEMPYGICSLNAEGLLSDFIERPSHDMIINTGMYIINTDLLKLIPDNTKFDANDFIEACQKSSKRIGVFPIAKNRWLDTGEWNKYYDTLEREQYLKII